MNRQDQIKADWITAPASVPSGVTLTYQVGVSVSSNTSIAPTLTGWVSIASAPPVTLTGLGLSDGNAYYFFVRTLTTVNGVALPPSPIKVGTVHVDVSQPSAPGQFLNLPKDAPSGVLTVQWTPTATTGPSGLYSYKIRQFTDGSPVPVEIIQTSTPSFTFGSGQTSGVPSFAAAAAFKAAGVLGAMGTASPLQYLNGETGGARAAGHFYRYQVQSINGAGTASDWSEASSVIDTGLPTEIISAVSNYPNPWTPARGGWTAARSSRTCSPPMPKWISPSTTSWVIASWAGPSRRDRSADNKDRTRYRPADGTGPMSPGKKFPKAAISPKSKSADLKAPRRLSAKSVSFIKPHFHSPKSLQVRESKKITHINIPLLKRDEN